VRKAQSTNERTKVAIPVAAGPHRDLVSETADEIVSTIEVTNPVETSAMNVPQEKFSGNHSIMTA
jgi:hypothetical protein